MPDEIVKRTDYPSNSNKKKEKDIQPVVQGAVKKRKKPFLARAADAFLSEGSDGKNVGDFIVWEVIIPTLKDGLFSIVSGGLEMFLYGDTRRSRRAGSSITGYASGAKGPTMISYNDIAARKMSDANRKSRSTHEFDDIVFDSKSEAEEVLSDMVDTIVEYGFVSVEDFYRMCGLQANPVDRDWGWTNLSKADTRRVSDGYIINLPKTQHYD